MNARTLAAWLAVLTVYNLAIAAVVFFFMVHCGSVGRLMLGESVPVPPDTLARISIGRTE